MDWVRGVAALAVVVFHINQVRTHNGDLYDKVTSLGWLGVPVFFFVSGYCISLAVTRQPMWREFLLRRLARIYLPYLASVAVVGCAILWRKLMFGSNDVTVIPHGGLQIVATLVLLIEPVTKVHAMNWVYWTLPYEVAFYVVVTIALIVKKYYAAILLAVTAASVVPVLHNVGPFFFLKYWGLYSLGLAMARGVLDRKGCLPLVIVSTASIVANQDISTDLTALMLLIAGCVRWIAKPVVRCRPLTFLGKISYSLYLIHVPVGIYAVARLFRLNPRGTLNQVIASDVSIVCCCVAAASVFWFCVERPSIAFGRRLSGKPEIAATKALAVARA